MAKIIVSKYNPVKFYEYRKTTNDLFRFRNQDDWSVYDSTLSFQDDSGWMQPWQVSDEVRLQIQSDSPGLTLQLVDCNKRVISSVLFEQKTTDWKTNGYQVYEAVLPLASVVEGYYYFTVTSGITFALVSDPINIAIEHEETMYVQYRNRKNKMDLAFDTDVYFNVRVPAVLQDYQPSSDDSNYVNQYRSNIVLSSIPYNVHKLIIGGPKGVPDYVADLMNRIFTLSNVLFDGVLYTKLGGAKMERNSDRLCQMSGWSVDITETINSDGKVFDPDAPSDIDLLFSDYNNILTSGIAF